MTANRTARRLGLLGLSLIITLGKVQAAPSRTNTRAALRPMAGQTSGTRLSRRRITLERSETTTARQEWAKTVRTEIPQIPAIGKEYGPFGVWQNRRFERGETPVPPSVHIF